jgi:hypothetical protein
VRMPDKTLLLSSKGFDPHRTAALTGGFRRFR